MTDDATGQKLDSEHGGRQPGQLGAARFAVPIARILLGLMFLVFGLNGFFNFIPQPSTPLPEEMQALMVGFSKSGYMFPLLFGTQVLVGILLLGNIFVPLAIVLIAPVIVNIIALHAFVQPSGIAPGAVALALELYLIWAYRDSYCPMFRIKAAPHDERLGKAPITLLCPR